jgi:hypothetical protein
MPTQIQLFKTETINYHVEIPYVLSTKIQTDDNLLQKRMIACIEQQLTRNPNYHGGYTFEVKDPCNDFAKIYNTFFSIVSNIFGPFNLSTKQRNYCWANVYNKDSYRSNLHHHLRTSSVNGIFYLNLPSATDGGLKLVHDDQELTFMPENLDLLIMPAWMPHEPLPVNTLENRIAINMEIATIEHVDDYYLLDKIFKKATPNV